MEKLQENEKMILNELRKNARVSMLDVARKTNIPLSTIYDKVNNYEKGLIKKHTSILDFQSIGYNARKIVILKTNKESRQEIQTLLENHPNVNSLFRINSGFDYLAEIVAKDSGKIRDILEELESQNGILSITGYDLIEDVKREAFEIK